MAIVHREVQRLNVLIGDLLDYANPRPKQTVDFDLGSLVQETVQVARGDQNVADVELAASVDEPLPIHADPAKLRQVVWNLVRNAADAASSGGKHVRVEARRTGAAVTITVSDDGPGIPEPLVGRIFDPFVTTKQKGTGLGLATCHAIIAEHGGASMWRPRLARARRWWSRSRPRADWRRRCISPSANPYEGEQTNG